jgi:hypothetical protein
MNRLSKEHRVVLLAYLVSAFMACLWVPWRTVYGSGRVTKAAGWGWLWAPPSSNSMEVDFSRLSLVLLGLAAIAAIAVVGLPVAKEHRFWAASSAAILGVLLLAFYLLTRQLAP